MIGERIGRSTRNSFREEVLLTLRTVLDSKLYKQHNWGVQTHHQNRLRIFLSAHPHWHLNSRLCWRLSGDIK